jgi:hypothetical protein
MRQVVVQTLVIIGIVVLFCGANSKRGFKNIQKCDFEFVGVSDFEYAGVKFDNFQSINDIYPEDATRIIAATTSKTAKISFVVNVKVSNPSSSWAAMNAMKWTLYLNGDKLLDGDMTTPFSVEPHCSGVMMLQANITPTIRGKAAPLQQIFRIYQSIMLGNEDEKANLTLKIKPILNKTELPYILLKLN